LNRLKAFRKKGIVAYSRGIEFFLMLNIYIGLNIGNNLIEFSQLAYFIFRVDPTSNAFNFKTFYR
jgi:hypothetical protein